MESKAGTKTDGLSLPNQNTILINIIWYFFIRYGKSIRKFYYYYYYNEFLTSDISIMFRQKKRRYHIVWQY